MFKLVIVEDEDNIRHSLECFIPWEEIGFQVVGAFSDGKDALVYISEHPCDAVLTDILMSRTSGLEVARQLHKTHPHIKVVILSGHSDFAYAQQAIEYNVAHYLVKPVDEEVLIGVFRSISEQLDERQEELAMAGSETKDLKLMLKKCFIRDLLHGRVVSENELNTYRKLLDLEIREDRQLLAYDISARHRGQEFASEDSGDLFVEEMLQKRLAFGIGCSSLWFEDKNNQWRVIFLGTSQQQDISLQKRCSERMHALVDELNDSLTWEFSFHLTHAVSKISELLTGIKPAEVSATPVQKRQVDGSLCEAVVSDYKLLIIELDLGSKDTLVHILNGFLYDLKDTPTEDVQFILKNLYSVVELNYKKRKINVWDITNGKFNFNHLYRTKDLDVIANFLKEDFCALCDGLKTIKQVSEHNVVGHLVQYLNEHLNEDIAHDAVAARYRMHPGYLSRLFKQEMGETLSEYLLRIKSEKAAILLKQGRYKIGEVADMVGYKASSYFSIMFKKYTGYSPREYIQRISP